MEIKLCIDYPDDALEVYRKLNDDGDCLASICADDSFDMRS